MPSVMFQGGGVPLRLCGIDCTRRRLRRGSSSGLCRKQVRACSSLRAGRSAGLDADTRAGPDAGPDIFARW